MVPPLAWQAGSPSMGAPMAKAPRSVRHQNRPLGSGPWAVAIPSAPSAASYNYRDASMSLAPTVMCVNMVTSLRRLSTAAKR